MSHDPQEHFLACDGCSEHAGKCLAWLPLIDSLVEATSDQGISIVGRSALAHTHPVAGSYLQIEAEEELNQM